MPDYRLPFIALPLLPVLSNLYSSFPTSYISVSVAYYFFHSILISNLHTIRLPRGPAYIPFIVSSVHASFSLFAPVFHHLSGLEDYLPVTCPSPNASLRSLYTFLYLYLLYRPITIPFSFLIYFLSRCSIRPVAGHGSRGPDPHPYLKLPTQIIQIRGVYSKFHMGEGVN